LKEYQTVAAVLTGLGAYFECYNRERLTPGARLLLIPAKAATYSGAVGHA